MFFDNAGVSNSIGKALVLGKQVYAKLLLPIFIPLLPSLIYAGYLGDAYWGNTLIIGYYILFGITYILSLFALLYRFKLYHEVSAATI